ncbi:N-acetyltransferase [Acidovorax radicis]|uniref:N-acetyltransferase n=1 Tax=Acidovorax radicis TaxID=758826 RepID=UPI001CF9159E|nr:N-acetyltransferase [Acidovorax radicis]
MDLALVAHSPFTPARWGLPWPRRGLAWLRPAELRIDVDPTATRPLPQELDTLHGRLHTPGDRLYGLPRIPLPHAGFAMRYREADGEWYVYVEDLHANRLAGYTVFNRLIEVDRYADEHVRAPHSRYDTGYQRRGLASAVYRWALGRGLCLVSGARQSPGAHALWESLAREYDTGFVDLAQKPMGYVGPDVPGPAREALSVRRVMLGQGWTMERFAAAVRMRL